MYKNDGPYDAYVDITRIGELHQITRSTPLTIGGGVTISNWIELFDTIGSVNSDYWYAPNLAEHFRKIGSVSIRNVTTSFITSPFLIFTLRVSLLIGSDDCWKPNT